MKTIDAQRIRGARRLSLGLLAGLAFLLVPSAAQQGPDEGSDPQKIIKQISDDLETIVKDLATLSGATGGDAGTRAVDNMEKLIDGMTSKQNDVVKGIDELIKQSKQQQSQSQSSGNSQSSSSPKGQKQQNSNRRSGSRRDRNQAQGKKEREQGGQDQQQSPEGQQEKQENGDPQGSEESKGQKEQRGGNRPPEKPPERYEQDPRQGAWGFLPREMQQKLIENNFREYFPDYEKEIDAYLKSVRKKR